jgi:hypothetical protein
MFWSKNVKEKENLENLSLDVGILQVEYENLD